MLWIIDVSVCLLAQIDFKAFYMDNIPNSIDIEVP